MTWKDLAYSDDVQSVFVIGFAGEIPVSTEADIADFLFVVPFDCTIVELMATLAMTPDTDTTFQLRRSTDGGSTWSNITNATVVILTNDHLGSNGGLSQSLEEGDLLNVSVTGGGGSGENLAVFTRVIK